MAKRALKQRSLIFILSDFFVPAFESPLMALSVQHEAVLVQGFDVAERGEGIRGLIGNL